MDACAPPIQLWLAEALAKQLQGDASGALLTYRRILSRDPEQPDAWCNLGRVLLDLGRVEESRQACRNALRIAPDNPVAHCNLGNVSLAEKDLEGALEAFRKALDLDPESLPALSDLSAVLGRLGRLQEALETDERALRLDPGMGELHLNRGYTLMHLGRLPEAEEELLRALECSPGHPKARWNLAYARLLQGRYRQAWPDFQARLQIPEAKANLRSYGQPRWNGEPFPDKTLLVWVEQGLGDTLQFARCLAQVKPLGGKVIFQVYPSLAGLMAGLPGPDLVVTHEEHLPPFDLQAPLLDLPALLGILPGEPECVPYLAPPQGYVPVPALARNLARLSQGPRIGVVWAGSSQHADDSRRSLDPRLLEPLAALPGVQWISLQVGAGPLPPLPGILDLGPLLEDFSATAHVLEHCDLLLSVDTAVAHLAGGMGVPVLTLLPFFPDWRWGLEGGRTPWYPSMALYRQPHPGAWREAIAQVLSDLA